MRGKTFSLIALYKGMSVTAIWAEILENREIILHTADHGWASSFFVLYSFIMSWAD